MTSENRAVRLPDVAPAWPARRFVAEWEPQWGVLLAWPHADTDWLPILDEVTACYRDVARAIAADERVVIVAQDPGAVRGQLADIPDERVTVVPAPTNDTWARDFGPLSVEVDAHVSLLDFTFNAWGMKFAADQDNLVTSRLADAGVVTQPVENHRDMVLEGGSVETDGRGTILTTSRCLLSPNRNARMSRQDIERELRQRLGGCKVLWLDYGHVPGDDTDCHIDTLARLAPGRVIIHATARPGSEECDDIGRMIGQLGNFTDSDGRPFRLVALPAPAPVLDEQGTRLPATYANYLVTNTQVLVPTYGQPDNDRQALETIAAVFTDRRVTGIDCRPLIVQHGSLHCITMQLHQDSEAMTR